MIPGAQGDMDVHILSTEARMIVARLWCIVYLEGNLVSYLQ